MPNHCYNSVKIVCPSEEEARTLKDFLEGEDTEFDFNRLVPMPEELLEATKDPDEQADRIARHGHHWWYEWRIANWGTKWNSYDDDLDEEEMRQGLLHYTFATAWSPPDGICRALLDHLAAVCPDATVNWFYEEEGDELRGQLEQEVGA